MKNKFIKILGLTALPLTSLVSLSITSCAEKFDVQMFDTNLNSKGKLGLFWARIKEEPSGKVMVSINSQNDLLELQKTEITPLGTLVETTVQFKEDQQEGTKELFDLTFSYTLKNGEEKEITLKNLSLTYKNEGALEKKANDYCELSQQSFINNTTSSPHDYKDRYCKNFYCTSDSEAYINWAHHPGYPLWSQKLHDGNGDTSALDNNKEQRTSFDYPGWKSHSKPTKLQDYKYLDAALSKHTTGFMNEAQTEKVRVYHGYEPDEAADLKAFVDETIGLNIANADPTLVAANINKLIGKSYTDWSWCATSFDYDFSYTWAKASVKFKTSIFLDITVDPDVHSAYISYSRKKWNGIYLSRPENYQLLIQRHTKFTVTDAKLNDEGSIHILYLTVNASKTDM